MPRQRSQTDEKYNLFYFDKIHLFIMLVKILEIVVGFHSQHRVLFIVKL